MPNKIAYFEGCLPIFGENEGCLPCSKWI